MNANQTKPDTYTTGGVAEFQIDDPVVAFQGSGTAKVPSLVLSLDATGRHDVTVDFDLRDIDAGANTTQPFNVQYRVGDSSEWTNVDGAYSADASTDGTSSTHMAFTLPSDVDGQSLIQVRFLTADSPGSDEFLGVDNIHVTSLAGGAMDSVAPDNKGVVTFGSNKLLDLEADGRGGDTVATEGINSRKGCATSANRTATSPMRAR